MPWRYSDAHLSENRLGAASTSDRQNIPRSNRRAARSGAGRAVSCIGRILLRDRRDFGGRWWVDRHITLFGKLMHEPGPNPVLLKKVDEPAIALWREAMAHLRHL